MFDKPTNLESSCYRLESSCYRLNAAKSMLIYGEEAEDKDMVKMPRYRADSQFNSKTGSFRRLSRRNTT